MKSCQPNVITLFLKTSNHFIKVVAVRHSKWKVFQKQTFHLTSTIYLLLLLNIKKLILFLLLFFSNFLSFDSRVFIFFVFCVSSTISQNSISCGICLSFKTRHLELFCKIIIQLFSTGIFLGLWSRGSPCNFTEQLLFLHSCEWLQSFNKCNQKLGTWKIK